MASFVGTFKVVPAMLGDNATAMGAAAWGEASGEQGAGGRKKERAKG